jgi:DsbC/DsbD-like thiol-disulfide interchange protein
MMMADRARTALFFGANLVLLVATPALAADASAWDGTQRSGVRLIAGGRVDGGASLRAGIEMRLAPGWKTYWRYPGDSGVPPVFDFSGSQNLKSADVLFPVPKRFPDGAGGQSIGYMGSVVLPLHVVAQDASKPVTLRVKLDYAACEKLCVPAKANLELLLTGAASAQDRAVGEAEARVPKSDAIGERGTVRAVSRDTASNKVLVDVTAPAGGAVALFAEGPTAQWALPLPEPVAGAPAGSQRFAFVLDGLPPGEKPAGATLRLTAVAGERAVEVAYRLD